jgi:hypothetical protein
VLLLGVAALVVVAAAGGLAGLAAFLSTALGA